MVSGEMATVLAMLDRGSGTAGDRTSALAAAAVLGVDGLTAGVGTGPAGAVLAWGTGTVSATVDQLQFTLGEGPGTDCAASGTPVLEPDLSSAAER